MDNTMSSRCMMTRVTTTRRTPRKFTLERVSEAFNYKLYSFKNNAKTFNSFNTYTLHGVLGFWGFGHFFEKGQINIESN